MCQTDDDISTFCLSHFSDTRQRPIDLVLVIEQARCKTRVALTVGRAAHDDAFIMHSRDNFRGADSIDILREALARKDVQDLGVTVRFQLAILRFLPNAEDQLRHVGIDDDR